MGAGATGDDALADAPFDWQVTKDGRVRVRRGGRHVVTIAGPRAERLRAQLSASDGPAAQQLLARATGNYRRGNERR